MFTATWSRGGDGPEQARLWSSADGLTWIEETVAPAALGADPFSRTGYGAVVETNGDMILLGYALGGYVDGGAYDHDRFRPWRLVALEVVAGQVIGVVATCLGPLQCGHSHRHRVTSALSPQVCTRLSSKT